MRSPSKDLIRLRKEAKSLVSKHTTACSSSTAAVLDLMHRDSTAEHHSRAPAPGHQRGTRTREEFAYAHAERVRTKPHYPSAPSSSAPPISPKIAGHFVGLIKKKSVQVSDVTSQGRKRSFPPEPADVDALIQK
ncbi:hypothetical protein EVAR_3574_1 [Eumeta japonica]|uniref:Uncharacterized protein n=1 Tax=Eumeta variegata TaxID=151549 RepID=A0A4C1SYG1_EUMVA|nr:hypothetical protein EVAR_3574_1 [Eumeta japonica]